MNHKGKKHNQEYALNEKFLMGVDQLPESIGLRVDIAILSPEVAALFENMAQVLSLKNNPTVSPASQTQDVAYCELMLFLIDLVKKVGTEVWRMRRRMIHAETGQPLEEMRRVYRYLESIGDILADAGVEIHDHTGAQVPEGGIYSLKTIAFEPVLGASCEFVLETVKPTIYFQSRMIQMGEVIVGMPG